MEFVGIVLSLSRKTQGLGWISQPSFLVYPTFAHRARCARLRFVCEQKRLNRERGRVCSWAIQQSQADHNVDSVFFVKVFVESFRFSK
jgi:hypothetical protein